MPKKFDLISIGDSTHDTFVELEDASIHCDIIPNKCLLCLSWADKVPAREVTQVPGVGNAANAAVGSARLGLKTAIYTNVGDDMVGENIQKVFKQEGVVNKFIEITKNSPSNYSVVLNYGPERTIIVHHERWVYELPKGLSARWFYYSSLAPAHKKLHKQIPATVRQEDAKLAFQPGTFQLREGKNKLKDILKATTIILLNREEAQLLLDITEKNPKKLLLALHGIGPQTVVMTDGPKGAYAYDGARAYFTNPYPPKAIERTGAGDGFSIGFVAAMAKGKQIEEALLWGNANSTSVVQYVGAQEGLLDEAGIKKMMKKYKKIKPKVI